MSSTPVLVQTPKITPITIVNADASNKKVVATAGASGSKVVGITLTSDDTSSRVIQLWLTRSAVNYLLGSVTVPTLAGTDGVAARVTLLGNTLLPGSPVDNDGQPYLFLESGDTLSVSSTTTVTAAKTVTATAIFGNF